MKQVIVLIVKRVHLAYPKNMREFRKIFATEDACLEYLIRCRWPEGFCCPRCRTDAYWFRPKRKILVCQYCRHEISPMAGTLMHRSHLPVQEWFWAAYLVSTLTPGISALQLQRQLGLGSYRTAWFLLQRLRRGMVHDTRTPLRGMVEADEAIIGGPVKGKKGRGVTHGSHASLIVGAVEVRPRGGGKEQAGRLRLAMIRHADENTIRGFLRRNITPGSIVKTDGWRGYSKTALAGFAHDPTIQGSPKNAPQLAPHIHRAFSNLKTWLNGTHHGVEPKYLPGYLDEFVFRFNRRKTPMAAFQTLLGITSSKTPLPLTSCKS